MITTQLPTDFAGQRGRLFKLALGTSLLTILTVGFYRFWMKTRLRRYYWSSIRPGGTPLEYVGEPIEKLLGFLIAVVFLAFYIGIVNLLLMFASFSLFAGTPAAYALSFIGVIPILFYAQYRARRYILGRTRWRGIRLGLDPGAWGYAWRALVHWAVTIVTLGVLWPRMTFWLEKYRTDRTYFGDARLAQGGHWRMLFHPFRFVLTGAGICAASGLASYFVNPGAGLGFVIGVPMLLYGIVHYRVHSFRILTGHKTLNGLGFQAAPRPWRMVRIYLFGNLLMWGALILIGLATVMLYALIGAYYTPDNQFIGGLLGQIQALQHFAPRWLTLSLGVASYFTFFVMWGVLSQVLIRMPRLRHYAETLTINGAPELAAINQRARDQFDQAEGFAEALDVGAAI